MKTEACKTTDPAKQTENLLATAKTKPNTKTPTQQKKRSISGQKQSINVQKPSIHAQKQSINLQKQSSNVQKQSINAQKQKQSMNKDQQNNRMKLKSVASVDSKMSVRTAKEIDIEVKKQIAIMKQDEITVVELKRKAAAATTASAKLMLKNKIDFLLALKNVRDNKMDAKTRAYLKMNAKMICNLETCRGYTSKSFNELVKYKALQEIAREAGASIGKKQMKIVHAKEALIRKDEMGGDENSGHSGNDEESNDEEESNESDGSEDLEHEESDEEDAEEEEEAEEEEDNDDDDDGDEESDDDDDEEEDSEDEDEDDEFYGFDSDEESDDDDQDDDDSGEHDEESNVDESDISSKVGNKNVGKISADKPINGAKNSKNVAIKGCGKRIAMVGTLNGKTKKTR